MTLRDEVPTTVDQEQALYDDNPAESVLSAHCFTHGLTDEDFSELMAIVESCVTPTDLEIEVDLMLSEGGSLCPANGLSGWMPMVVRPHLITGALSLDSDFLTKIRPINRYWLSDPCVRAATPMRLLSPGEEDGDAQAIHDIVATNARLDKRRLRQEDGNDLVS
jgi:hypothetical protein